jgi:hypothetical protein
VQCWDTTRHPGTIDKILVVHEWEVLDLIDKIREPRSLLWKLYDSLVDDPADRSGALFLVTFGVDGNGRVLGNYFGRTILETVLVQRFSKSQASSEPL